MPSTSRSARIGVVGATGAVGTVTLELLQQRGFEHVRVFASARSAGKQLGPYTVEEATPDALAAGDIDVFLFSVGTSASREVMTLSPSTTILGNWRGLQPTVRPDWPG